MLHLIIPGTENWDPAKEEFVYTKPVKLTLEHSLVSVSKWEAKWERSFMSEPPKKRPELLDYVRCMTITQNVPPEVYANLTPVHLRLIESYINSPGCATKIYSADQPRRSKRTVTSELIYCWMIQLGIPFECEKWHLNRLLTLIKVCDVETSPSKKQNPKDILRQNSRLNAERRRALNSRG